MTDLVILLRAIGPVTHRLMSMNQWREAAASAGFENPETVVNTGNMIAGFQGGARQASTAMLGVLRSFGLKDNVVPIVRTPALLYKLLKANPIPEAAADRPDRTGVYFFAAPRPDFGWLEDYQGPESIHVVAGHLVVDFTDDTSPTAKLIRLIDRIGGTNTSRNWSSVRRLAERCRARPKA